MTERECTCSACVPAPPDPDGSPQLDAGYLQRLRDRALRPPSSLHMATVQFESHQAEVRKLVREVERLRLGLRAIAGMESVAVEGDPQTPEDLAMAVLHGYPMRRAEGGAS